MLPVLFALILTALGIAALYGLWRLLARLESDGEETAHEPQAEASFWPAERQVKGTLGPDGIVYLAAHRFVPMGSPRCIVNVRRRAFAPLTGDEVEPREMAEQLLYATLVSLTLDGLLHLSVGECEPSFMGPFPHKRWTVCVRRKRRLTGAAIAEALDCAFDIAEQRRAKKGYWVEEGIPLDELIDDMIKVMRQELSFWEKAGIYADIRQYVEAALIDQGYLVAPPRDTWFDRLRHLRPTVNESAVDQIERRAEWLASRLTEFRQTCGSARAATAASVPGGSTQEVDESLIEAAPPFDHLPLHDCLKISVYEALMAIRQLEPSEDVGV